MRDMIVKVLGLMLYFGSTFAAAQESPLTGKYSGGYESAAKTRITIVLDVKIAQNGEILGTAHRYSTARRGGQCVGEYQVSGTLKDNAFRIRSIEKGGAAGDCSLNLTGNIEGDKLLAKLGQNDFVMTKQD